MLFVPLDDWKKQKKGHTAPHFSVFFWQGFCYGQNWATPEFLGVFLKDVNMNISRVVTGSNLMDPRHLGRLSECSSLPRVCDPGSGGRGLETSHVNVLEDME